MPQFDFQRFKQEINLTQYAASLGYRIDRSKSTRHSISMRLNNSDKVVITKRNGTWLYFSVYDDQDCGTIIDFAKNRLGLPISHLGPALGSWLNGGGHSVTSEQYIQDIGQKKPEPERIKRLFNKCIPIQNNSYLKNRGIEDHTLREPRFFGRVFQDQYSNAVFPHFKNNEASCLELKGQDTSLIVRGSEKTLWRSNVFNNDTTLIIAESPIDAMSYHLLYNPKAAFYIATSGGVSPLQGKLIQELLTTSYASNGVIVITDNDKGGERLFERLNSLIMDSGCSRPTTRHSPPIKGQDWNNVLCP